MKIPKIPRWHVVPNINDVNNDVNRALNLKKPRKKSNRDSSIFKGSLLENQSVSISGKSQTSKSILKRKKLKQKLSEFLIAGWNYQQGSKSNLMKNLYNGIGNSIGLLIYTYKCLNFKKKMLLKNKFLIK